MSEKVTEDSKKVTENDAETKTEETHTESGQPEVKETNTTVEKKAE